MFCASLVSSCSRLSGSRFVRTDIDKTVSFSHSVISVVSFPFSQFTLLSWKLLVHQDLGGLCASHTTLYQQSGLPPYPHARTTKTSCKERLAHECVWHDLVTPALDRMAYAHSTLAGDWLLTTEVITSSKKLKLRGVAMPNMQKTEQRIFLISEHE
ncbi:hypothetical protein PENSPDRAFT_83341 [Peniophora sp. CONT]|nr:hypothetical protein PENSPDRAFT_83341 [Peniophora sp. CONT]